MELEDNTRSGDWVAGGSVEGALFFYWRRSGILKDLAVRSLRFAGGR